MLYIFFVYFCCTLHHTSRPCMRALLLFEFMKLNTRFTRIINLHQNFLVECTIIKRRAHSVIYRRAPPQPSSPRRHALPRCMHSEGTIHSQGVIVGNPDTIYNEATTQAFPDAIVGKCRLKFSYMEIGSHRNYP